MGLNVNNIYKVKDKLKISFYIPLLAIFWSTISLADTVYDCEHLYTGTAILSTTDPTEFDLFNEDCIDIGGTLTNVYYDNPYGEDWGYRWTCSKSVDYARLSLFDRYGNGSMAVKRFVQEEDPNNSVILICNAVAEKLNAEKDQPVEPPCDSASGPFPQSGNPITVSTGNKFQKEVDYESSKPFGLNFTRYYNSLLIDIAPNKIGNQWSHSFGRHIVANDSLTVATLFRGNGQTISFSGGDDYTSGSDNAYELVRLYDESGIFSGWQSQDEQDNIEIYNVLGQLLSITNRIGQTQTLSHNLTIAEGGDDNDSTLDKITGHYGEVLWFTHGEGQVSAITTPDGAVYRYDYDGAGNLTSVTYPDNNILTYHYEEIRFPHHLTGITDENGARFATWTYNDEGLGISSEHTDGTEKETLEYRRNYVTVTNPLGKQTTYYFDAINGVKKLTYVEGHASENCAAADKTYSYDTNGYLASKTDWQGNVTTYVHDARGLETSRTEASGTPQARTITTQWYTNFRLPIRITAPGQVTNFVYDTQGRLTSQTTQPTQP